MMQSRILRLSIATIFCLTVALCGLVLQAQEPTGFTTETVVSGLNVATTFAFAPDGRIFIAEKNGTVRIFKDGQLLPDPFIVLPNVNTYIDRGLIGMALDQNFEENGYVYLAYTHENNPADFSGQKTGRIVRVTADGDKAVPGSMVILVGSVAGDPEHPSCQDFAIESDCIPSDSGSHSVGGLRFGPDGKLYATIGDGARFDIVDPFAYNVQDIDSLAGKVLRINTDGTGPSDNPFYNGDPNANRSKVFAYGIRNSFRFNFRPTDGTLFLGEVGWGKWEEINIGMPGANFGWPCREGFEEQGSYVCDAENATDPIYVFDHNDGPASITGGDFAGSAYPSEYVGDYIFGDFHRNTLYHAELSEDNEIANVETWFDGTAGGPVDIQRGPDGAIYYLAIFTGELRKIVYRENLEPQAELAATPTQGDLPLVVSFSADGTFDPENDPMTLTLEFGDGTSTTSNEVFTDLSHFYAEEGHYTAVLSVTDAAGGHDEAEVQITAGDPAPPPVGNAEPVLVEITRSTEDTVVGDTVNIVSLVRNDGEAEPIVFDIEVYDSDGTLIKQYYSENQTIPNGNTREFTMTWIPSHSGIHRVSVGLFAKDWSGVYQWYDEAMTIRVFDREISNTGPMALTHASTTVTPSAVEVGDPVSVSTTIQNVGGLGEGLVDIEIYDASGTPMHQEVFDSEIFDGDETKTFATSWTPSEPGTYFVDIGIFNDGWTDMFEWVWHAATIVVNEITTGVDLIAEMVSTEARAIQINETHDIGEFEIKFDVSALGSNVYVPAVDSASVQYHFEDENGTSILDPGQVSASFSSAADQVGDVYRISAGETEAFTLFVGLDPQTTGQYKLVLDSIDYGISETDPKSEEYSFASDFETDLIVLTNGVPAPAGPAELEIKGATASPRTPKVGEAVNLEAAIENTGGAGTGLVNIVVFNNDFTAVEYQTFYDNEGFAAGETRTFTGTWTPSEPGTYWLEIGTFGPNWEPFQNWASNAAQIVVTDGTGADVPFQLVMEEIAFVSPGTVVSGIPPHATIGVGQQSTVAATVGNVGEAGKGVVQFDIYNEDNTALVHREYFENVDFAEGETQTFHTDWTPTEPGTYWAEVGIFGADWATSFGWHWHAIKITVTDETIDPGDDDDDEPTPPDAPEGPGGSATIVAYSIVCDSEAVLPNWGVQKSAEVGGDGRMDLEDINAFIDTHSEHCAPAAGWEFEYGDEFPYPDSNIIGPSGLGSTFGPTDEDGRTAATIPLPEGGMLVWTRLVPQDGYVLYNGKTETEDVSGEFYCHIDLWHYDNNEEIYLSDGDTYFCLSMTAPADTAQAPDIDEPSGPVSLDIKAVSADPTSVAVGEAIVLEATIENSGAAGRGLVDFAVFNEDNSELVYQSFYDHEAFAEGETRTYTDSWTPAEPGTYWVEIGTFGENWDPFNSWAWHAVKVTVTETELETESNSGEMEETEAPMGESAVTEEHASSTESTTENTKPVITLLGDETATLTVGDTYADPGATANDAEDGDLTANIVVGGDTVDTSAAGTYTVTYDVADSEGLAADQVARTVIVQEENVEEPEDTSTTTPPVL